MTQTYKERVALLTPLWDEGVFYVSKRQTEDLAAEADASLASKDAEIADLRAQSEAANAAFNDARRNTEEVQEMLHEANAEIARLREDAERMRETFEAAVVAHGALFELGHEPRPDRPALEAIWIAVDKVLAACKKG